MTEPRIDPGRREAFGLDGFQIHETKVPADLIGCRLHVAANNPYFQGHFPARPVLPGVVQLMLVDGLLRATLGDSCRVVEFRRVRFSAPIEPGDELKIEITESGTEDQGSFRIENNGSQACRGFVVWQVSG